MEKQSALTLDWWMHELYRCVKSFIYNPTEDMQKHLTSLLEEYRLFHEMRNNPAMNDEHEQVMDFR